jgi:uncharacterized protein
VDSETPTPEAKASIAPAANPPVEPAATPLPAPDGSAANPFHVVPAPAPPNHLRWIFYGSQGFRSGWSAAIFLGLEFGFLEGLEALARLAQALTGQSANKAAAASAGMSPLLTIVGEGIIFASVVVFALLVALIERRNPFDYNLRGPGPLSRFFSGLVAGLASLSALVGGLYLGGWIHFGPVALHGGQIASYAALWAVGFLLVGLTEEGTCRCFLQFTLTRGINFWWALGLVGLMCAILIPQFKSESAWGVWFFAALGLFPCLILHQKGKARSAFWYAAWATSTFFGFVHTGNNGENWIGIFAAASIGFAFCVSVYLTGSAWWAIGCHAAWDWAETFFYGTADSGNLPKGHFLSTAPAGSALWSGGTDGPEGSLLVLPTIVLILVIVLVQYRRKKSEVIQSA